MQVISNCIENFINSCSQPTQNNLRETFSSLSIKINQYFAKDDSREERIPEYAKDIFLLLVVYCPLQKNFNKKRETLMSNLLFTMSNTHKVDSESKRLENLLNEYLEIFYSAAESVFLSHKEHLKLVSKKDLCNEIKTCCCNLERAFALCYEIFDVEFPENIFENPYRYDSAQEIFSKEFTLALREKLGSHVYFSQFVSSDGPISTKLKMPRVC